MVSFVLASRSLFGNAGPRKRHKICKLLLDMLLTNEEVSSRVMRSWVLPFARRVFVHSVLASWTSGVFIQRHLEACVAGGVRLQHVIVYVMIYRCCFEGVRCGGYAGGARESERERERER